LLALEAYEDSVKIRLNFVDKQLMAGGNPAFGIRSLMMSFLLATLLACAPVLSERTDEGEWLRFRAGLAGQNRAPAAESAVDPGIREFRVLLSEVQVRSIFFECASSGSSDSCYRERLGKQFNELSMTVREKRPEINRNSLIRERARFLETNSYEVVSAEIERFHQGLLSGIEISAREHVRGLVKSCGASLRTGGVKELNLCLKTSQKSDMDLMLAQTADRLGLRFTAKGAPEWIREHQIAPIYEMELNRQLKIHELAGQPSS